MQAREQCGVAIHLNQPFDPALIKRNMFLYRDRHECVGSARFRIDLCSELPFTPTVIVFVRGQAERFKQVRTSEKLVAPLAREEAGQHRVVGLAYHTR